MYVHTICTYTYDIRTTGTAFSLLCYFFVFSYLHVTNIGYLRRASASERARQRQIAFTCRVRCWKNIIVFRYITKTQPYLILYLSLSLSLSVSARSNGSDDCLKSVCLRLRQHWARGEANRGGVVIIEQASARLHKYATHTHILLYICLCISLQLTFVFVVVCLRRPQNYLWFALCCSCCLCSFTQTECVCICIFHLQKQKQNWTQAFSMHIA